MTTEEILRIINSEDQKVPAIVAGEIEYITQAVDLLVESFQSGGRLFYIGAGSSGRLGILDAAECPPTFGTDPEMIQGILAGGPEAIIAAKEGSEDQDEKGRSDLVDAGFTKADVACGIAASRRTPGLGFGSPYPLMPLPDRAFPG